MKCYDNVLLKKMIPEVNRLAKHNEYLFMQNAGRAHLTKITLEMLKYKKEIRLLKPHHWPPNSPDLNSVDFAIWGLPEQYASCGRRITDLDSLKKTVVEERNKIPHKKTLINVLMHLNLDFACN